MGNDIVNNCCDKKDENPIIEDKKEKQQVHLLNYIKN